MKFITVVSVVQPRSVPLGTIRTQKSRQFLPKEFTNLNRQDRQCVGERNVTHKQSDQYGCGQCQDSSTVCRGWLGRRILAQWKDKEREHGEEDRAGEKRE